jgi:hypothetical protein
MALKQQPTTAALWHDLGVSYYRQMKVVDRGFARVIAAKSLEALKKAVVLDPTNHAHWTAVGVVAASAGRLHVQTHTHTQVGFTAVSHE